MNKSFLALILILLYLFVKSVIIEPNELVVTKYQIKDKYLAGIKVAFLADMHLKKNDLKRLNKIAARTAQINPDIIILGGDIVQENKKESTINLALLSHKFKTMQVPVFAVLGESDWKTNGNKISLELVKNGIGVLDNSSSRIISQGRYVDIIGLADISKYVDINSAFNRTRLPRIVVTHNPDVYFDIMDETSVILAGHTHGGQFILPFSEPMFVSSKFGVEFASGLIEQTSNKMIISKGIGTTGLIKARLNCKPEIVLVEFVK